MKGFDYILFLLSLIGYGFNGVSFPLFLVFFADLMNAINLEAIDYTTPTLQIVYVGIAALVSGIFGAWAGELLSSRLSTSIRKDLLTSFLRQEIAWYDSIDSGGLIARVEEHLTLVQRSLVQKFCVVFLSISCLIGSLVVAFTTDWLLSLWALPGIVLVTIIVVFLFQYAKKVGIESSYWVGVAGSLTMESFSAIRTVAAYGLEKVLSKRYRDILSSYGIAERRTQNVNSLIFAILNAMFYLIFAWVNWHSGKAYLKYLRDPTLATPSLGGDVLTVILAMILVAFYIGFAGGNIVEFLSASAALGDLDSLMERKSKIDCLSDRGLKPKIVGKIEFRNVSFSYPSRPSVRVLHQLNFCIENAEKIALVGVSGVGKSTIMQLLQRFYDPDEGEILLDDIALKDYNVQWLRSNFGVVVQNPPLLATSIRENLTAGLSSDQYTDDDVIQAVKDAQAYNFISQFPNKFETNAGFRGNLLSGGQKQRIAIARALLRKPSILLLDEATSALDTVSEYYVQQALDTAVSSARRTTILIAHRLSTIRNADRIFFLANPDGNGANVNESGSHDQLIEKDGLYSKLIKFQLITGEIVSNTGKDNAVDSTTVMDQSEVISFEIEKKALLPKETKKKKFSLLKTKEERYAGVDMSEYPSDAPAPTITTVFRMAWANWPILLCGIICAVINGVIFPCLSILFAYFMRTYFTMDIEKVEDELFLWSMLYLAAFFVIIIVSYLQNFFFELIGTKLVYTIRDKAFTNLLHQEISYHDNVKNSPGAISNILTGDTSTVKKGAFINLAVVFRVTASLVSSLVIAFYHAPELAAILTVCILFGVPGAYIENKFYVNEEILEADDKDIESPGMILSDAISNVREIYSYVMQPSIFRQQFQSEKTFYKRAKKNSFLIGAAFGYSKGFALFVDAFALYMGGYYSQYKGLDRLDMMKTTMSIVFGVMGLSEALQGFTAYSKTYVSLNKVFLQMFRKSAADARDLSGYSSDEDLNGSLEISNLSFTYKTRPDSTILNNISLKANSKENIALVGYSGSGKSTILLLLERFYDYSPDKKFSTSINFDDKSSENKSNEMKILIDGREITDYNLSFLRNQIAYVSQEPILFDFSIKENIRFGKPGATDEEVINSAKAAYVDKFVSDFPDAYDTKVGFLGTKLSGGQRQRIAIARAIIRNPKLLLLDEATSSLDTESEALIQKSIDSYLLNKKPVAVVIAHRLVTIRNSDNIYVFANAGRGGKIVESGKHDELKKLPDGLYSTLLSSSA